MRATVYFSDRQSDEKITAELKKLIRHSVKEALLYEKVAADCEISISFVDEDEIKELNASYRSKDAVTDVLSFPLDDDFEDGENALGDVVICVKRAKEQAFAFGHSLKRELSFLTVHSILHLLGYDHETSEADEKIMFAKQDDIMLNIGKKENNFE